MKRPSLAACILLLLFLSLACQSVPLLAHPTPTPTVTPTPTKTPTPTASPTPTGIPGITMPITIDGVSIQFAGASKETHFKVGSIDYKPTSSEKLFLVVDADVKSEDVTHTKVKEWSVTLNDGIKWSMIQSHGNVNSIDSVTWVFLVDEAETSFEIHLPGGTDILLNDLLG